MLRFKLVCILGFSFCAMLTAGLEKQFRETYSAYAPTQFPADPLTAFRQFHLEEFPTALLIYGANGDYQIVEGLLFPGGRGKIEFLPIGHSAPVAISIRRIAMYTLLSPPNATEFQKQRALEQRGLVSRCVWALTRAIRGILPE